MSHFMLNAAPNEPTKVSHHSRKRSPPPQQSSQVDPRKRPKHDPSDHQSTKVHVCQLYKPCSCEKLWYGQKFRILLSCLQG